MEDQASKASTKAPVTCTKALCMDDALADKPEDLCWTDMKMQVKQCVDLGTKKLAGT